MTVASTLDSFRIRATTTAISTQQEAKAAASSKLQRYLKVNGGGIHACARFSTRYEANDLIQWLYYHKRVGISFFHMCVLVSLLT